MKPEIEEYFKSKYGKNITIETHEDQNYGYDLYLRNKNVNISVEYKERFFIIDRYLKEYDILVELVQSTPYLKSIDINNIYKENLYKINIAVGWLYKCNADRLIFFRWLNKDLYDVIDISFYQFKNWFMNNINDFNINYSNKTTGTINAIVKLEQIPKIYFNYWRNKGKQAGHTG